MYTILFILMLVVSTAVTAAFLREARYDIKGEKTPYRFKKTGSLIRIAAVAAMLIGVIDGLKIVNFKAYSGAFLLFGFTASMSFILCEVNKKKKSPTIACALKVMLIASVLEVTLFNLPVYRLWTGNFKRMDFSASRFATDPAVKYREEYGDIDVTGETGVEFTLEEINQEVGNIFVDLDFGGSTRGAMIYADAMDETQTTAYRIDVASTKMVVNHEGSQFLDLELSGKVKALRFRIVPINGGTVYVNSISLNADHPMEISWLRYLLIVFLVCLVRAVISSKTLDMGIKSKKQLCHISAAGITIIACFATIWINDYKAGTSGWGQYFKQSSGDQMSQELVEAFEHGSTSLLIEPSEGLKNFDDPYDRYKRESHSLDIEWDHVFYGDKYYSYYGIAPVILLFMPYHLITGYFLSADMAAMLFAIIGIIGLTFAFTKFINKYFPKTPLGLYICSLIIIQTVSGIWFSVGRPMFYEVAIAAGFAFLTWAVYFFMSADIIGKEKPSLKYTALSSLFFAIAVLSRPTLVFYCICAACFMLAALPRASSGKKLLSGTGVKYIVCAIVPMAMLGMVQMWYNYDRFGSPFEFGIQYSLTINNFTKTQFHWQFSMIALYNYLFNPPVFTPVYPIVSTKFQFMDVGGYFFEDYGSTLNTSGLFFIALPMFAYLFSGRALKTIPDRRQRVSKMIYIGIPCVVIPFLIISSVWESGYAVRYMADFAWQSLLGAFAIIFWLYSKNNNEQTKRLIRVFMCFATVWTLFVAGVQDINQIFRFADDNWDYPEIAYEVEQFFAFWK